MVKDIPLVSALRSKWKIHEADHKPHGGTRCPVSPGYDSFGAS